PDELEDVAVKPPALAVSANLIWARDGTTWALWRIPPIPYRYLGAAQQRAVHARTRAILGALPAESLLMSVCRRRRPEAVVARMVEDVDLRLHPAWASEGLATLDEL